ncbi:MAG: hypothetical protein F9K45_11160 [Melioribacteraceae bacterium]|nr:MAG: hypothetical protein F9K45_11160 [Melioribacteraceae bacterium]
MQFNELLCQHSNIKNNTRFNSLTGHVKRIYNADIEVPGSSGIEIAKKYLELNNKLIGNQKELSDLTFIKSKKSHDVQHFFFKQNYNGIEVINSGIVISLNKENKITTVYSDYFPIVDLNTIPSLSVIEAEAIAKNAFKNYDRNNVIGKSELKIYADKAGETHLVYEVSLNMENFIPLGMVLVDSHNGSVLEKSSHGQSFITGKGKVFDPDPGTYFRDATLTASSNVDAAYKTNVNLTNLDGNGNVQGRYAKSINSNYLPNDLAYNSQNNFSYIRTQTYFKEVNVYYFINKMREYIGTLGISPTWKDGEEFLEYDASVNSVWAYGLNAVYFGTSDQERL